MRNAHDAVLDAAEQAFACINTRPVRCNHIHRLRSSGLHSLLEGDLRIDFSRAQPTEQSRVIDVAIRSKGLGPNAAARLAQVQFDNASAVVFECVKERDLRIPAPTKNPVRVEAELHVFRISLRLDGGLDGVRFVDLSWTERMRTFGFIVDKY